MSWTEGVSVDCTITMRELLQCVYEDGWHAESNGAELQSLIACR